MFDKTCRESFNHIDYWMEEVKRNTNDKCTVAILGNKSDLECVVEYSEASLKAE